MGIIIPQSFQDRLYTDKHYRGLVDTVLENIESYFNTDPPEFFPEYTLHGFSHIEKLLELADRLIDSEALEKLQARDVAVLVLSIALHDISMFLTKTGLHKFLFSDKQNKQFREKWEAYYAQIKRLGDDKWKSKFDFDKEKYIEIPENTADWTENHIKVIGDFLREYHHKLSHEIINGKFPVAYNEDDHDIFNKTDYAINDNNHKNNYKTFRDTIGIIAESHGMPIRDTETYLTKNSSDPSDYSYPLGVPVYYLMAVLRLADYLHVGDGRAPKLLKTAKGITSPYSNNEWTWNQKIDFDSYRFDTEHGYLHISAHPEIGWGFIKINEWLLSVQTELDFSWAVISEYYANSKYMLTIHRIKSNILDKKAVIEFEKVFVTERANFKVVPDLLKLLIQPLYGDNPTFGVRELLQNAVDACNEREVLGNYPDGEEGKIEVSVDTIAKTFTISDNGIGMTKDVILNHYLSIGSSYRFCPDYLNKFVEDGQNKVSRSGRFGIGVLAMFLIGTSATVTTRSYDEELGYQFTLELEQENIEIRRIECEVGTVIVVGLCEKTTNYFTNTYSNKRSSWYITRDSHSDYLRYLDWLNWYWLNTPNIVYRLNNNEPQTAYNIYNENSEWFQVESKIYSDYKWQYSKEPSFARIPLFCNGIAVLEVIENNSNSAEYGYSINTPNISIFERDTHIELSLSRSKCLEIPESKALFNEVYKYIIACLLNQRIPCFENGEKSPL